jgi:hypothetical protein
VFSAQKRIGKLRTVPLFTHRALTDAIFRPESLKMNEHQIGIIIRYCE